MLKELNERLDLIHTNTTGSALIAESGNVYVIRLANMIIPIIKSFDCIDHDPIKDWMPSDPTDVNFWMNFSIGPHNEEGADYFQANVVTPAGLDKDPGDGRVILLDRYSWERLQTKMNELLESCCGQTWADSCQKLSKHLLWEFENYREHSEKSGV